MVRRNLTLLCSLLCAAPLSSQLQWTPHGESILRSHARMVFDETRGRLVLYGGIDRTVGMTGDVLEAGDRSWQLVPQSRPKPGPRWSHAMAFDVARGNTVVFGGRPGHGATPSDETWMWDGTSWWRGPSGPPGRIAAAMAYDRLRQRTVLFGGLLAAGGLAGDTWEWDGASWTQASPLTSPLPRWGHAMAFDTARGRVVLCGGGTGTGQATVDTWEWDGTIWTERVAAVAPPQRTDFAMAYDVARARLILHGGNGAGGGGDTWEWDGQGWTQRTTAGPPAATNHALAYDTARQRVVMFGTYDSLVYEWDGQRWTVLEERSQPGESVAAKIVWDPVGRRTLMFGVPTAPDRGLWSFDGQFWRVVDTGFAQTGAAPDVRYYAGWTFDSRRGVAVTFGGRNGSTGTHELWEFDGSRWRYSTAAPPPGRFGHLLEYDAARGRCILFGGVSGSSAFHDDTWSWDGSRWRRLAPVHIPAGRADAASTYDPVRERIVMYGGRSVFGAVFADTWEWDGVDWNRRLPATDPGPRAEASMVWDTHRRRGVLIGGAPTDARVWEWDGALWAPRTVAGTPGPRVAHALGFDPDAGHLVMFGGLQPSPRASLGDTWTLAPVDPARFEEFGTACAGGAQRLAVCSLPWVGDLLAFAVEGFGPATPLVVWCGFSNSGHPGGSLPASLAAIGMPGCDLLVSPDVALAVPTAGGQPTVELTLPNDPALVGGALYFQAFGVVPGANPLGVLASSGGAAVLGAL